VPAAVTAGIGQRLSSGVDKLGREVAEGEIPPDYDVVGEANAVVVGSWFPA
jgi:hypothetical protein